MQRAAGLAVLGAAAAAALYLALAASSPVSLGFFGDDAVYATTAKALAEGKGYRHLSIPGEPLQTKYPPLYPAVLSLVLRARPDLPDDFPWLLVPTALAGAGAVLLSALYWRRILGASGRLAAAIAVLAALSPAWLAFTRYTMSELLYALLATAALLCLDEREPSTGDRRGIARLLLGAALVGCAVLTRPIGVSLAIAAVATPVLRRRTWDALLVLAVILSCVAPWWSWQSSAEAANGAAGHAFLVAHELGYSSWLPGDPLEALRVAGQNLLRLSFGLGYFQLALPVDPVRAAIGEGGARLRAPPRDLPHEPPLRALGLLAQREGRPPDPSRVRRDLRHDPPALDLLAPTASWFRGRRSCCSSPRRGCARLRRSPLARRRRMRHRPRALPRRGLEARAQHRARLLRARGDDRLDGAARRRAFPARAHAAGGGDRLVAPREALPHHRPARALLLARHRSGGIRLRPGACGEPLHDPPGARGGPGAARRCARQPRAGVPRRRRSRGTWSGRR